MDILIVEGNTHTIIEEVSKNGIKTAAECYIEALSLHAPDANYEIYVPFAPDISTNSKPIDTYDAYALTGSGVTWTANSEEAKPYLEMLKTVLYTGKPVIGSCWGMQCAAVLFDGTSEPNEAGTEIGLAEKITLTEQGRNHWLFDGVADTFASPCIHRDHVTHLPDCFELLASNPVSPVQAIAYRGDENIDYCGMQYHPEFTLGHLEQIVAFRDIELAADNIVASFPTSPAQEVTDAHIRTRVFANWMRYVMAKSEKVMAAQ